MLSLTKSREAALHTSSAHAEDGWKKQPASGGRATPSAAASSPAIRARSPWISGLAWLVGNLSSGSHSSGQRRSQAQPQRTQGQADRRLLPPGNTKTLGCPWCGPPARRCEVCMQHLRMQAWHGEERVGLHSRPERPAPAPRSARPLAGVARLLGILGGRSGRRRGSPRSAPCQACAEGSWKKRRRVRREGHPPELPRGACERTIGARGRLGWLGVRPSKSGGLRQKLWRKSSEIEMASLNSKPSTGYLNRWPLSRTMPHAHARHGHGRHTHSRGPDSIYPTLI